MMLAEVFWVEEDKRGVHGGYIKGMAQVYLKFICNI